MSQPHSEYVIIGVDPGLMTGVFVYFEHGMRDAVQYPRDKIAPHTADCLKRWAQSYGPENIHIAVEQYIITARTAKLSQQPDALEVTGMVKGFAQVNGITDVRQYRKSNLRYADDAMLEAVGWSTPGKRHATDAARQAFALLKDVDAPHWNDLVHRAKVEAEDERTPR